ncbi:NADP(+)-dependent dehydrogenase [Apiospora phragmitis]|uniref:NADP(+)-dependent dehydrogenase n=1 Tax=Apiospora phragmitis TaxID=2905665 RepID=A0ABR1WAX4_9PEZI
MADVEAIKFSITNAFHKKPYPSISPLRPELSKAGKSILITGGGGGIGFHIAKAFSQASAATLVIVGRREDFIKQSAAKLGQEFPKSQVLGLRCDIAKSSDVETLWADLKTRGIFIDVLVLNATIAPPMMPLLELGTKGIMESYNVNLVGNLDMTERFYKQEGSSEGVTKYVVHLSSVAAHNFATAEKMLVYGLSKNAGALAMQLIAQDTKPEVMQIVTFNPGPVWTPGSSSIGIPKSAYDWNDADLPGQFAVWAASPEAAFLHGRFVWNEWDVDEMKSGNLRKKIDENPTYLRIGVHGI